MVSEAGVHDSAGGGPDGAAVDAGFAMVHEVPNQALFWGDVAGTTKPGGKVLLAEPMGPVNKAAVAVTLDQARRAGLVAEAGPRIVRTHTAFLTKSA